MDGIQLGKVAVKGTNRQVSCNNEISRSYHRATKAAEAKLATQPRAAKAHYDAREARLVIELTNGVILMLPPKLLQGLKGATTAQLAEVQLTPLGTCLHWEALDADFGIAELAFDRTQ